MVARHLHVHTRTVRYWIRNGHLPALNIGTGRKPHYLIYRDNLLDFLRSRGSTERELRDVFGAPVSARAGSRRPTKLS